MITEIADTPCRVKITRYYPPRPANLRGHPDFWAPHEDEELEYEVEDLEGRPAPHLEEQLTPFGRKALLEELHNYLRQEREMGDY